MGCKLFFSRTAVIQGPLLPGFFHMHHCLSILLCLFFHMHHCLSVLLCFCVETFISLQNQLQPVDSFIFRDQPYKNYARNDRLWMHAAEQKISSTNIAVDISNTKEQQLSSVVPGGPNRGREVLAPTRCGSNSMRKNSAKCYEVPESISGQNADFLDRSIEHGENVSLIYF